MTEYTDIYKLGITSLTLSLILLIITSGFQASQKYDYGDASFPSSNTIFQIVTQHEQSNLVCEQNDQNCTSTLQQTSTQSSNVIDPITTTVNIYKVATGLIELLAMIVLFPIYLDTLVVPMITNVYVIGLVALLTLMWQALNVYMVVKIIFKR